MVFEPLWPKQATPPIQPFECQRIATRAGIAERKDEKEDVGVSTASDASTSDSDDDEGGDDGFPANQEEDEDGSRAEEGGVKPAGYLDRRRSSLTVSSSS